jgi:hypothetical protein
LVGETNLQEAYNQLLTKLKNVEIEKESLVVKLHEMDVVNDSLKHENSMLIDKVKSLEDVCNFFL